MENTYPLTAASSTTTIIERPLSLEDIMSLFRLTAFAMFYGIPESAVCNLQVDSIQHAHICKTFTCSLLLLSIKPGASQISMESPGMLMALYTCMK
jgi:hypothetical protein